MPLLERDRRRVELLNSLLLSMPGTPVIYYGDEIGMGDNIHLGDRDGVRTPMQWSPDRNGGFSKADPASLVLPPIMDPLYGFQAVNVEAQSRDPYSLLNWMRRLLAIRKQHQAFGRGTLKILYPNNRRILAYLREYPNAQGQMQTLLCVANVSHAAQAVELDLAGFNGRVPVELVGGSTFPPVGQFPYLLTLPPYGFYWFLLAAEAQLPSWHVPPPEPLPEFRTLVLRKDVSELLAEPIRGLLEREILPAYLPKRRWFGAKNEKLESTRIVHASFLPGLARPILLAEVEAKTAKSADRYLLPLGFLPEDEAATALPQQLSLARVRRGRNVGYLTDAFALDALARGVIDGLRHRQTLKLSEGELRFLPTSRIDALELGPDAEIRRLSAEQSNSSLVIGDKAILKVIRKVAAGIHPEAEMGRYLTEHGFANIAPMIGEVTRVDTDGTPYVLSVVQGFMHNQGDAWSWTQNMLDRAIHEVTLLAEADTGKDSRGAIDEFAAFAGVLGKRIGEMHAVLSTPTDDSAFAPESATDADCVRWSKSVQARLDEAFEALSAQRGAMRTEDRELADGLIAVRKSLKAAADQLARRGVGSLRMRIHGDLHLGQVLVAQGDAYIIDFEGEPARPLAERRGKYSPLRDVAGMLRSFDYAAAMAVGPDEVSEAAEAQKHALIDRFADVSSKAFLDAYGAAAAAVPHRWADAKAESALVELFTLEKAAYEIAYEASNRPAWLPVPLKGLAAIAQRLGVATNA
jgi:maltose alpha-D-glucosyltransferase/alpha-amylase